MGSTQSEWREESFQLGPGKGTYGPGLSPQLTLGVLVHRSTLPPAVQLWLSTLQLCVRYCDRVHIWKSLK